MRPGRERQPSTIVSILEDTYGNIRPNEFEAAQIR